MRESWGLSGCARLPLSDCSCDMDWYVAKWKQLDADIAEAHNEIERIASAGVGFQRLRLIPGVAPLASTATVAAT